MTLLTECRTFAYDARMLPARLNPPIRKPSLARCGQASLFLGGNQTLKAFTTHGYSASQPVARDD